MLNDTKTVKTYNNIISEATKYQNAIKPIHKSLINNINKYIVPYFLVMRLNNIAPVWLLAAPCFFGTTLAITDIARVVYIKLLFGFLICSLFVRSAACIINDIVDREIDHKIQRTSNRPMVNGTASIVIALIIAVILLITSLLLAIFWINVPILGIVASCILTVIMIIYPFTKRFTCFAELFSSICMSGGALIGYIVVKEVIEVQTVFLYVGCVVWAIGYHMIYSMQDRVEDEKLNLKSLAVYFGKKTPKIIYYCYSIAVMLWTFACITGRVGVCFMLGIAVIWFMLIMQVTHTNFDDHISCRKSFMRNTYVGLILWLSIVVGKISL